MAFVDDIRGFEQGLVRSIQTRLGSLRRAHSRNRAIRATIRELSRLSDAELYDLGIDRSEIQAIARGSVEN